MQDIVKREKVYFGQQVANPSPVTWDKVLSIIVKAGEPITNGEILNQIIIDSDADEDFYGLRQDVTLLTRLMWKAGLLKQAKQDISIIYWI